MGGISGAIGDATGLGGKGGFRAPQHSGGQPQMGFGFNPNTDMPFTGGQNAGNVLGQGIDSILGATPIGGAFNQALGGQSIGSVVGNGVGSILGPTPLNNAFGLGGQQPANSDLGAGAQTMLNSMNDMLIRPGLFSGNGQQPMPTSGMGGGKGTMTPMFIDGNGNPTNDHGGGRVNMNINPFNPAYTQPQGPQIGFGPAPIEQNPMDIFGLPGAQNYNRQSPIIGNISSSMPPPQPVNRFAPPNAPGVRQQPRTAPRAGIPVQSARTVQPNRFTRNRTR